jgi:hypothetical protein
VANSAECLHSNLRRYKRVGSGSGGQDETEESTDPADAHVGAHPPGSGSSTFHHGDSRQGSQAAAADGATGAFAESGAQDIGRGWARM